MSGSAGSAGSGAGSAGMAGSAGSGGSAGGGAFTLTSPAFDGVAGCDEDNASLCDDLPAEMESYMGGMSISPELNWTGAPAGTMSFAIVFRDLTFNDFTHWVIWNIPGTATGIPGNIDRTTANPDPPAGSQQASLGSGAEDHGFYGPGSDCNVYGFILFALSVPTFSPNQATNQTQVRTQLENLGGQILGQVTHNGHQNYMGTCQQ
jgi:phosphatidylethanolamine-binding protein (PEBP) family uncharacterized protein